MVRVRLEGMCYAPPRLPLGALVSVNPWERSGLKTTGVTTLAEVRSAPIKCFGVIGEPEAGESGGVEWIGHTNSKSTAWHDSGIRAELFENRCLTEVANARNIGSAK